MTDTSGYYDKDIAELWARVRALEALMEIVLAHLTGAEAGLRLTLPAPKED
jgi:hypothetical protein